MLADYLDDVTDSQIQNAMVILDEGSSTTPLFSPASLAVTYSNIRILEKYPNVSDIPRVTYIHLGLNKQPHDKSLIYMNTVPKYKSPSNYENMSNV